jgi:hypothetical protein
MLLPTSCRWAGCTAVVCLCLFISLPVLPQTTAGRILGRVADPSGAVLANVKVEIVNEATGLTRDTLTNAYGDYNFIEVVPATYTVRFELVGFKTNVHKGVKVDVTQVVALNGTLNIGETHELVQVTSEAPQVDTTSTQLGAVINDRSVNELPLNTRDTYQFLQLQPGVQSQLGSSGSLFFGTEDAGSVSVNGGRTRANNFSVNGGDANDQFVNLPTVQPTPDAIDEFRVITNSFDAEYGRNSGSVVNVITKSGTNGFHGDVYEYFRNTLLNAQGYFNTTRPQHNQNQYGGTFGGPIKKDRSFFFISYEGRRIRQGQPGPVVNVLPTTQSGTNLGNFNGEGGFSGGIQPNFPLVAQVLDGRSGCDAKLHLPSGYSTVYDLFKHYANMHTPQPTPWSKIFENSTIPIACMDPVAINLLQRFVPSANTVNQFGAATQLVPVGTDNEDQFTARFDHKISDRQNLSVYYYFNDGRQLEPYDTFEQAGANVPGFGNSNDIRYQQWNLTHTLVLSSALVNEAHFTYMREGELGFLKPQTTNPVTSSCTGAATPYCFTGTSDSGPINSLLATYDIPAGKGGITPGLPANLTGVPYIDISGGAEFGNNYNGFLPQVGNSFQWSDNLTWVKGNHTIKFGADVRRARFDQFYYFNVNGYFTFNNTGPNAIIPGDGDQYAEYLLGLVDAYTQGSGQSENVRSTSVYPFVQDSWKIRPNVTLNYGLRWELDTPPTDISGHVETFRPGQNSTVYPCGITTSASYWQNLGVANPNCTNTGAETTGLVVPGDAGVPAGLTSTYYKAFAPRIGIAYSPNFDSGPLGKLFGGPGKTSIKAGWGLFYNPIEELVMAQFSAEPPFGGSSSLSDTFFNTPFVYEAGGTPAPNPFNGILIPTKGQPTDLSFYRPILLYGEFGPHLRTQYTAQYNLTIQRELSQSLMMQVGYVGSQGHRLLASHDINPSNPQTCLDMYNISQYYASSNPALAADYACGPTVEDSQWILPAHSIPAGYTLHLPYGPVSQVGQGNPQITLVGLRPYSSPNCNPITAAGCPVDGIPVFTDVFGEDTVANSSYNALEMMLQKRFSHGLQFQAAYTFSKSLDNASTFEETLNPYNFGASRALSLFNAKHRFVFSYDWELPVTKHAGVVGWLVNDWSASGIIQYQSGFPIRLDTEDDTELIDSLFFLGTEAPSLNGKLQILDPKANGGYYLNYNQFSDPPNGHFNNGTQRTQCCGPGLEDWDVALHRKIPISQRYTMQFRGEIFNLFNHTNFANPDGHYSDGATEFGKITQAGDPRLVQFALKLFF